MAAHPTRPRKFRLHQHPEPDGPVLELEGDFDLAASRRFDEALHVAEQADQDVLVDLSRLRFIDTTGVRMLLGADQRLRAAGHRLRLRRGPDSVQRVFELMRLDGVLTVV
jgi:anti-sigma B factor antagonist